MLILLPLSEKLTLYYITTVLHCIRLKYEIDCHCDEWPN